MRLALAPFVLWAAVAAAATPAREKAPLVQVPLAVRANGEAFGHEVMSAFVLPGEVMPIEVVTPPMGLGYSVEAKAGVLEHPAKLRWTWRAPEAAGVYAIQIKDLARDQALTLNVFVMVPFGQVRGGRLNGYRIGEYPPARTPAQAPPRGFIEVTKANDETRVTPHFRLKQFVCKQPGGFPKYVVLDDRLLLKLEHVLAAVNRAGRALDTLHVMSAYRTPFYNALIDNVKYSQHQWGSAADVFLDKDDNDLMDDLNADHTIDKDDARMLFGWVDAMDRTKGARFVGGLGLYGGTKAHGPFVHVDVRGSLARW